MENPSVFIAESLDAEDFYDRRLDGMAAHEVLKVEASRVEYRMVLDRLHLVRAVNEASEELFDVLHLSCHGDFDGICLADKTEISWVGLAEILKPFSSTNRILVMSSCKGGNVALTKALQKCGAIFGWVFGATEEVGYTDSCVAWSVLYRVLEDGKTAVSKKSAKKAIDLINDLMHGDFVYRRWDASISKYKAYPFFEV
ncbi:MAG: hypothetical protein WBW32_03995 [Luteibacter sp.]